MKKLSIVPLSILLSFSMLTAQGNVRTIDSLKQRLKELPESKYDSVYMELGGEYYTQYNPEGYRQALEYFLKVMVLGEKYKKPATIAQAYFLIATVYDAEQDGDKTLYYYKKAYDMCGYQGNQLVCLNLLYNVAHAYHLKHDSTNSMQCLQQLDEAKQSLSASNPLANNKYNLLIAYLSLQNNNLTAFLRQFAQVDKNIDYKDGRFHYGRYFAICNWRYAFESKDYKKAIGSIQAELKNAPADSAILIDYLAKAYSKSGDYKAAYEWSELSKVCNAQALTRTKEKDLTVGLLKAENTLQEKEKQFFKTQREGLLLGLIAALIAILIITYYWKLNVLAKKELLKRNREKEVLMHELQHRVKNNLQLMYGLNLLQLDKLETDKAKTIWEKNLTFIKSMSIINDKLYQKDIETLSVKAFVEDITQFTKQLFDVENKIQFNFNIQHPLSMEADFATSFGLILSELITNSFKHALKNVEKGGINITIEQQNNTFLMRYSDSGNFSETLEPLIHSDGIRLMGDLTQQLKGKMVTHYLGKPFNYCFTF